MSLEKTKFVVEDGFAVKKEDFVLSPEEKRFFFDCCSYFRLPTLVPRKALPLYHSKLISNNPISVLYDNNRISNNVEFSKFI